MPEAKKPSLAPTEAGYTVGYYFQQADGSYKLEEQTSLVGEVGKVVEAKIKEYPSYSVNSGYSDTVMQGVVKQDGSLVLKIFYKKDPLKVTIVKPSLAPYGTGMNDGVNTGDTTNIKVLIGLLGMSLLVMAMVVGKYRKSE